MTTEDGRFRAAIVGCGRIAGATAPMDGQGLYRSHAGAYHASPEFTLGAVAHPHDDERESFRRRWGVAGSYPDLGPMLDAEPIDALSVCTPTPLHKENVVDALAAPDPPGVILVEKPVCISGDELRALRLALKGSRSDLVVNHTYRFDAGHRRIAAAVQEGRLGRLIAGRATYYGGWLNNGVHLVDTLRLILPGELGVEHAEVHRTRRPGDPDLAVALAAGDALVEIDAVDEALYQLFELDLRFTEGRLRIDEFGTSIRMERVQETKGERGLVPDPQAPTEGMREPFRAVMEHVAAILAGTARPDDLGVGLKEAERSMAILWEARRLARLEEDPVHAAP